MHVINPFKKNGVKQERRKGRCVGAHILIFKDIILGGEYMNSVKELTDPEKLLAIFEVACEREIPIEERYVDSYVYLLKVKGLPFKYSFVFHPLPYSNELRRDLLGLRMAGYLTTESIVITPKGREFVRQTILPEFRELFDRIREYLAEFRLLDRRGLFEAVYARIV